MSVSLCELGVSTKTHSYQTQLSPSVKGRLTSQLWHRPFETLLDVSSRAQLVFYTRSTVECFTVSAGGMSQTALFLCELKNGRCCAFRVHLLLYSTI